MTIRKPHTKPLGRPRTRPESDINPYKHIAVPQEDFKKILKRYHQAMAQLTEEQLDEELPFSKWVVQQLLKV
jgi:hypothetical protein